MTRVIPTCFLLVLTALSPLPAQAGWNAGAFHIENTFRTALQGFALSNEPIRGNELQDDAGAVFNVGFALTCRYRQRAILRADIAVEGRSRYGLLCTGDRNTLFGKVEAAGTSNLTPFFDTLSLELRGPAGLSLTAGIIRWLDKNKYANPGITLSLKGRHVSFQAHYADIGKRSRFFSQPDNLPETPDIPSAIDASYTGARVIFTAGDARVELTGELVRDRTPSEYRWNMLSETWGDICKDDLGTVTASVRYRLPDWNIFLEAARNMGHTEAVDGTRHGYAGRRYEARLGYRYGAVRMLLRYTWASGHPWPAGGAATSDFKGFAAFPPTDLALFDSHYAKHEPPPVFTGGTLTPFYGVPRPGWFIDTYALDNLETFQATIRFFPVNPLAIRVDAWLIRADKVPPLFTDDTGMLRYPSKNLGTEWDMEATWTIMNHVSLRAFFGAFNPGRYYDETTAADTNEPLAGYLGTTRVAGNMVTLTELGVYLWF